MKWSATTAAHPEGSPYLRKWRCGHGCTGRARHPCRAGPFGAL